MQWSGESRESKNSAQTCIHGICIEVQGTHTGWGISRYHEARIWGTNAVARVPYWKLTISTYQYSGKAVKQNEKFGLGIGLNTCYHSYLALSDFFSSGLRPLVYTPIPWSPFLRYFLQWGVATSGRLFSVPNSRGRHSWIGNISRVTDASYCQPFVPCSSISIGHST